MRLATVTALALALVATACAYNTRSLPPVLPTPSQNSTIYARDGTPITTLEAEENRENIALEKLPSHLPQAVIAIEDERFYEHKGVDLTALLRAARANAVAGEISEGGSTITQQYVKNVYLDGERTIERKVEEVSLALQLERTYSKDLILELYLNTIYFGRGRYGVQAASFEYFGKPATELSLAESAMLAGMIQSPNTVDPFLHPRAALERREVVLDRMLELEMITATEHRNAVDAELGLAPEGVASPSESSDRYPAGHFVEEVKQWILNDPRFGETRDDRINLLFGGGLRIYTTIDLELQEDAEAAVAQVLPDPASYPDAAVVTLDPRTGQVLAMVGGRDYFGDAPHARYNLARGKGRQTGSAFKPIVLAAALQSGMPIVTTYTGPSAISITRPQAPVWNVRGGCGKVTLVEATVVSCNTVYAQLIMDVGADEAIEMARNLGITSDLETNEAAVLGTNDVTPLDMATAFGAFANHGYRVAPTFVNRVVRADGTVLYEHLIEPEKVLEPAVADLLTWTLEQVVERGTGTRAALEDRPVAGKTGTTENSWDAWFIGYTPQRVTAVWVGYPEAQIPMVPPTTPISVYGGTWPAEIWKLVMSAATGDQPVESFNEPPPEIFLGVGSAQTRIDNRHVPAVYGLPVEKAVIELAKSGFLAEVVWNYGTRSEDGVAASSAPTTETEERTEVPYGIVLDQYPNPDGVARAGSRVVLEVKRRPPSDGEESPDVVGATLADYYNLLSPELNDPRPGPIAPDDEAVG